MIAIWIYHVKSLNLNFHKNSFKFEVVGRYLTFDTIKTEIISFVAIIKYVVQHKNSFACIYFHELTPHQKEPSIDLFNQLLFTLILLVASLFNEISSGCRANKFELFDNVPLNFSVIVSRLAAEF